MFGELLYFLNDDIEDYRLCLNVGSYYTDLLLTAKMAMSFKDCYKNIVYTLLDISNWIGEDAKWLDSCESSSDEDVTIYSYTPLDEFERYWYGSGDYTGDCWPGDISSIGGTVYGDMILA